MISFFSSALTFLAAFFIAFILFISSFFAFCSAIFAALAAFLAAFLFFLFSRFDSLPASPSEPGGEAEPSWELTAWLSALFESAA